MAKTFDRQTVNGQEYLVMDSQARADVNGLRDSLFYGFTYNLPFEQGAIGGTGNPYPSDTNIRTGFISIVPSKYKIIVNSYRAYVLFYDENKQFISGESIWAKTTDFEFETDKNAAFLRIMLDKVSGEEITPVDNAVTLVNLGWYDMLTTADMDIYNLKSSLGNVPSGKTAQGQITENAVDITDLKNSLFYGFTYDLSFEQGAIGGTGNPYPSDQDIRTGFISILPSKYKIIVNGYRVYVLFYDASKQFISGKSIWAKTVDFEFETEKTAAFLRISVNKVSGEDITPVDNAVTLSNLGWYDLIKDIAGLIEGGIPKYYTSSYLNGKTNEIIENSVIDSGTSFAFITDMHLKANSGSSRSLMKYFADRTSIPFIISGGDIPTAYSQTSGNEKTETFAAIQEWLAWVDFWGAYRVYQMRGNHDYVLPSRTDNTKYYNMSNGGVHQQMMSKFIDKVDCPEKDMCYYHFDNETQKIRFIVLDGHTHNDNYPDIVVSWIFPPQINWLIDLLNNSDGYGVVLLSHEATDPAMPSYSENLAIVQTIAEAYKNRGTVDEEVGGESIHADFSNATGDLICILSGHSHKDASHVSNGLLSITTTCDALYNDDPNVVRTAGTVTESAFDIFSIDTENKTIKTVRIGGGSNREWSY